MQQIKIPLFCCQYILQLNSHSLFPFPSLPLFLHEGKRIYGTKHQTWYNVHSLLSNSDTFPPIASE